MKKGVKCVMSSLPVQRLNVQSLLHSLYWEIEWGCFIATQISCEGWNQGVRVSFPSGGIGRKSASCLTPRVCRTQWCVVLGRHLHSLTDVSWGLALASTRCVLIIASRLPCLVISHAPRSSRQPFSAFSAPSIFLFNLTLLCDIICNYFSETLPLLRYVQNYLLHRMHFHELFEVALLFSTNQWLRTQKQKLSIMFKT